MENVVGPKVPRKNQAILVEVHTQQSSSEEEPGKAWDGFGKQCLCDMWQAD